MEHGPHSTSRRESRPLRMAEISVRVLKMVAVEFSVMGRSSSRKTGGRTTLVHLMRRSSVLGAIFSFFTHLPPAVGLAGACALWGSWYPWSQMRDQGHPAIQFSRVWNSSGCVTFFAGVEGDGET